VGGSRLAAGELTGQAAPIATCGAALIRTGREALDKFAGLPPDRHQPGRR